MATDDADASDAGRFDGEESADTEGGELSAAFDGQPAIVGEYTWADFMREHGHGAAVDDLYPEGSEGGGLLGRGGPDKPSGDDWDRVDFDPADYLGFDPDHLENEIARAAGGLADELGRLYEGHVDPEKMPARKDVYTWEHFKHEYYYTSDGVPPTKRGSEVPFEPEEYLGWKPEKTPLALHAVGNLGKQLADVVQERTVTTIDRFDEEDIAAMPDVDRADVEEFDEDAFFTDEHGNTTLVNRYDLEKAVPDEKKVHFLEEDRYWVNKPYAFIIIFHSVKENEKKYYAIEPHLNEIESDLMDFMSGKLRTAIKYSDDEVVVEGDESDRADVIERETRRLLRRYDIFKGTVPSMRDEDDDGGILDMLGLGGLFGSDEDEEVEAAAIEPTPASPVEQLDGLSVRQEPLVLAEDPNTLNEYQVEKLLYYLKRNFIGYERIDPVKHDINVEDISVDGYDSPVFTYHSDHEQIISNIYHGEDELDDFVVKLAQRSGKGISKRQPQVDATLPDGSRAQLTLGQEVSDHGTNYTIRQFKDVPFTPIDLINWKTFSLDEMAYLWLCIENHKSLIFAGGTASGKTTSLNAVSLFIPSNAKIVSIEDTREVELPQRNWIASVTRPSFGEDDTGDVDEFDLLEAALRQRPDYIVMGEIRGEEGRTLFQVMSTGHTTYTTFHADSVGEVLKRFTTDPINVSKTMFTALDLVSIQTQTRVQGKKVRRNKNLTEINHYDAENDEINVQDVYQWQAETDEFLKMGDSNTLEEIMFDRGWSYDKLERELFKREAILAYLIHNGLNTYTEVAATVQAFINDPESILTLVANDKLARSLEDLREMESVLIDVDPDKEALVPRPDPGEEIAELCLDILDRAEDTLFDEYRGEGAPGLVDALDGSQGPAPDERIELPEDEEEIEFSGELSEGAFDGTDIEASDDDPFGLDADAGESPALEGASGGPPAEGAQADEPDDDTPDWLFGSDDEERPGRERPSEEADDISFGFESPGDEAARADDGEAGDGPGAGPGEEPAEEGGGFAFDDDADEEEADDDGGFAFSDGGQPLDGDGFDFGPDDDGAAGTAEEERPDDAATVDESPARTAEDEPR